VKVSTVLKAGRERLAHGYSYYAALPGLTKMSDSLFDVVTDYLHAACECTGNVECDGLASYDRAISMAMSDEAGR
jgi:hypothetical protein